MSKKKKRKPSPNIHDCLPFLIQSILLEAKEDGLPKTGENSIASKLESEYGIFVKDNRYYDGGKINDEATMIERKALEKALGVLDYYYSHLSTDGSKIIRYDHKGMIMKNNQVNGVKKKAYRVAILRSDPAPVSPKEKEEKENTEPSPNSYLEDHIIYTREVIAQEGLLKVHPSSPLFFAPLFFVGEDNNLAFGILKNERGIVKPYLLNVSSLISSKKEEEWPSDMKEMKERLDVPNIKRYFVTHPAPYTSGEYGLIPVPQLEIILNASNGDRYREKGSKEEIFDYLLTNEEKLSSSEPPIFLLEARRIKKELEQSHLPFGKALNKYREMVRLIDLSSYLPLYKGEPSVTPSNEVEKKDAMMIRNNLGENSKRAGIYSGLLITSEPNAKKFIDTIYQRVSKRATITYHFLDHDGYMASKESKEKAIVHSSGKEILDSLTETLMEDQPRDRFFIMEGNDLFEGLSDKEISLLKEKLYRHHEFITIISTHEEIYEKLKDSITRAYRVSGHKPIKITRIK